MYFISKRVIFYYNVISLSVEYYNAYIEVINVLIKAGVELIFY